ncbi:MAG: sigma-70 family RNA polymerase sigma factor [Solirubrobacteraceae bacterium]|nr:sigma-70 family RNA polymerase sigma factor [Patulibacter sp.]
MGAIDHRTDAALLAATDRPGEAYAVFYRRHLPLVLGFVLRRVAGDRELAADLAAEVFAAALAARASFDPVKGEARAWLCTIAARKVIDSRRRGRVEDEARRRLGMEPVLLGDEDLARVDDLASRGPELDEVERLVDALAPETRDALRARVVDELDYDEIAAALGTSESVVRKRVSRGLARLRDQLQGAR